MIKRKQKTVLQVIPALEIGGAERGAVEIARALVAKGWRALVISQGGGLVKELEDAGAEHITAPMAAKNPITMWRNARRLCEIIKREQVDIIHARSRAPAWSAFRAAGRTSTPFITTYHSIYSENFLGKRLYNSVMARGNITIANSEFTANIIRQRHASVLQRLNVVHRGVDLNAFSVDNISAAKQDVLRKDWQLDATRPKASGTVEGINTMSAK